jgi:hypothetical protein
MTKEAAYEIITELGEVQKIQFLDQNSHETSYHREYSKYVRRCEILEERLDEVYDAMKERNINTIRCPNVDEYLSN